jgi:type VI secretion system FHA domain protein
MLNVVALTYNDLAPAMPVSGLVPDQGGSIGRDSNNSLVLPDPMRLVSRRHVEFFRRGDTEVWVRNASHENGAQVDDVVLMPSESALIRSGSRIVLGCYLLEITIPDSLSVDCQIRSGVQETTRRVNEPGDFSASNVAHTGLANLMGRSDELIRGESKRDASVLQAEETPVNKSTMMSDCSLDPLELFRETSGDDSPTQISIIEEAGMQFSGESFGINHCMELSVPFRGPEIQQAIAGAELPEPDEKMSTASNALIPDDEYLWPQSNEVPKAGAVAESAGINPAGRQRDRDVVRTPELSLTRHAEDSQVKASSSSDNSLELFAAFLNGAGLKSIPDRSSLDPEFMYRLGKLLAISSAGLVRLLAGRSMVKREVRADVTVIAPAKNNPFKFSPDGNVALMYLLGKTYPGFMESDLALEETYNDLHAHQLGMISGMRSALEHVLNRFDPNSIEQIAQPGGVVEGLLAIGKKARLWDSYGRYFETTKEQAEDRFQDFFGSAFLDAYNAGRLENPSTRERSD